MADVLKPLDPKISDAYAPRAPKIKDPHDRPQILQLDIVNPTNADIDTVDKDTLQVRRTFKDASGAWSAYRRLKQQNVERNKKNQLIQRKLNNETPYKPKALESMGQDWRSNRPTGFLSTMVSRIQPPFRQVVEQATYLTYSKYPIESVDAEHKTKVFREEITSTVRAWRGWDDLIAQTTHENTCFGYCGWVWDDLRDWKPEFMRQDYTFFSIETPQETSQTQIFGRKRRYQIADLLPVLENPPMSAAAGWHINNLVKSINNAIPAGRTLDADDDARRYEDWFREGSYGASYENDAKYVELGELFIREPNGKVSRFLFDDKSGDEICTQLDRFNSMNECLALFAVEIGSGGLMSSRGAGRDLYNTHVAIDKARNLVVDNVYLKGMLLLKKGPNAKPGVPPLTVTHPVAYVSEGYEVIPTQLPADVDDFLRLDQFISGLAEIQIGTFLPGEPLGEKQGKRTASEVNRVAAIENQLREGVLMRWSKQISRGVERIQRGICHPEHVKAAADLKGLLDQARGAGIAEAVWARREVVDAFDRSYMPLPSFMIPFEVPPHLDEDAISCCLNMMERNLPASDILLLAYSSAVELMPDTTAQDAQMLDLTIQRYAGNPNVNQDELMKLDISRKLGEEIANTLILPKDQIEAIAIEATRQQVIELQSIMAGQEVPVSPRDNDMVHIQTMAQKLFPVISKAPQGALTPELVQPLTEAIKHFAGHLKQAEQKGTPHKMLAPYYDAMHQAVNHLSGGMVPKVPDNVAPAAAMPSHGSARGHGRAPHAPTAPSAADSMPSPGQNNAITNIANPPKPPTAAN